MTLIERLEKAGEGSRELDAEIAKAMGWTVHNARRNGLWVIPFGEYETCDSEAMFRLGEYTTSIDAALALAERVLPGWHYELTPGRAEIAAERWSYYDNAEAEGGQSACAKTTPLALCLAVLRATQEKS